MQLIRFYFSAAFMPSINAGNLLFAELSFTLFSKRNSSLLSSGIDTHSNSPHPTDQSLAATTCNYNMFKRVTIMQFPKMKGIERVS